MKRILHCFNGLDNGGVEAFVMSVYRNIDKSKYQFDFLLRNSNRTHYWDEIESMGGRIYSTPSYPKHAVNNYFATKKFLKSHNEYDIIHIHANSLFYMTAIKLAYKLNIKNRIIHSHNSSSNSWLVRQINNYNKKNITKFSTCNLACSYAAGKWMFNDDFKIINNGISTSKFKFNSEIRSLVRKELNLENKFVIGNIGRFVNQKNHTFLIEVFNEYQKKDSNAVLLLVGFGELESEIRDKIISLGLTNKVVILTDRNDPYNLLQAMDLFLFPSIYEGFGISLLEAQASGLPCVCSSIIPPEVILDSNIDVLSLDSPLKAWIAAICDAKNRNIDRTKGAGIVKKNGYDILTTCEQLERIYDR